jgi:uncharacterized membrane protein YeaQ/YmgE (transglycosylase-associated protein family)
VLQLIGNIMAWLAVGAVAGWLAGYVTTRNTKLDMVDVVLGVLGALLGGWIAGLVFDTSFRVFSIPGLALAIVGALVLAFAYKLILKKDVQ